MTTAKKLGCPIYKTCPMEVSIATGDSLVSSSMYRKCTWSLQGVEFKTDAMLVPLGGCEMVLGIQWLATLGPILWDFEHQRMEFTLNDSKVVLRGSRKGSLEDNWKLSYPSTL